MHDILTKETIISFDIETTGLVAGLHSMISLGAVAYRNGKEISCFYGAMHEEEGSARSEGTMQFWQKNLTEWKNLRKQARPIVDVMDEFYTWAKALQKPRVLAANPASFDGSFLFPYLCKYVHEDAVNELFYRTRALDIRTYIAALYGVPYSEAERRLLPPEWKENLPYDHNALNDARNQGAVLMNLLKSSVAEPTEG